MTVSVHNLLLFIVLPYVAITVFASGTLLRFRTAPQTFSSRSSQFFEGELHFWALTAFHFGITIVLLGHLAGLATPARMHVWTASPLRIHALEIIGLTASFMAMTGAGLIIVRRLCAPLVRSTTRLADGLVLVLLMFQLCTGVYIAVSRPWGAAWFEALVGPYVRSLFSLAPDTSYVAAMPVAVKTHLVAAWLIIAVFPFTRLVHMLVAPVSYFWRQFILVRWNKKSQLRLRRRRAALSADCDPRRA